MGGGIGNIVNTVVNIASVALPGIGTALKMGLELVNQLSGFMNQLNGNGPVAQEAKRAEEQVTAKLTETKNAAGNDFKRALNAAAGAVNTVAGAAGADPGATKVA